MAVAATHADKPPAWQVFVVTFVSYLLAARLALLLAVPPGIASPLFPAAGIALVTGLIWGRWALLGIGLGSMSANLWFAAGSQPISAPVFAVCAAIGIGAVLQAGVGAALVKRHAGQPLLLAEPAQLGRFMVLGGPLACCISASVGLLALLGAGWLSNSQGLAHWAAWWAGDTLGVLIFAPLMLTLIGRPREDWAPRRWPMALPLLAVTLLMGLGIREMLRLDHERQRQAFQREAENAAFSVQSRLMQPLQALEAMRGLVSESPGLQRDAFGRAAAPWLLDMGGLRALGWNERVERSAIAAFEARERASGQAGFRIFERSDAGVAGPPEGDAHTIRFIEPLQLNAAALGVNTRSIAIARAAIDQAVRSATPVASAGFKLTQGGIGVVLYQAVYEGLPKTADARAQALRGVVFATLRPDELLRAAAATVLPTMQLCLLDNDALTAVRVLAGPPDCDKLSADAMLHVAPLALAGRQWDLRVYSIGPPPAGTGNTWPFALVGLVAAAMLGALLLLVTGRARRIEAAVRLRTAELQQRSAELQSEILERQRTGAALSDSQHRLRNILDHAPIGVAYTDAGGQIREANPKLRQMLGIDGDRLLVGNMAGLLHPDDRAAEADARKRLLAGDEGPQRWQLRFLTGDGRTLWTQIGISVLRDNEGEGQRMVWVVEDITDHLALEEALRARRGAEAANKAKSDFLSRMSHELRTPLNAMLGFSQLLELDREQPLAPHQIEWSGQIRQAGWHLLHMINDTLDLSRIESGHVELTSSALDLGELVAASVVLLAHNAEKRGIEFDLHLAAASNSVIGDPTRVKQILTNLLSNAVKYNREGGRVGVTSRLADNGRVALEVSDTGSGLDSAQLAQLFQPFNRLGREGGPVEGTGIGLVISLRLAELMGGTLYARSAPGRGATFVLELPRALSTPQSSRFDDGGDIAAASYHLRRVHYIEDNETNVEVMRGVLALRPQISLQVSMRGLEGLASIAKAPPDLILLDMHLPDIDGLELLTRLQTDPASENIPVIVVSADATTVRASQAIAAGASSYLTKPINVQAFLELLDGLLEEIDTRFG